MSRLRGGLLPLSRFLPCCRNVRGCCAAAVLWAWVPILPARRGGRGERTTEIGGLDTAQRRPASDRRQVDLMQKTVELNSWGRVCPIVKLAWGALKLGAWN